MFQPFGNELFTLAGRGISRLYCWCAQPVLRFCGEHADVLLAEGPFQYSEMRHYYPKYFQNRKGVVTLPVGVNTSVERKVAYTPNSSFQFLAVSSLLPYEGLDALLRAFRLVHDKHHARLVIVGTGRERARLKETARGYGSSVEFMENISESDLQELYVNSDAFVCTSHETDIQMGVLEAMATGLPVLCRDEGWHPVSAMTFQGDDLAQTMVAMVSESTCNRRQMAENGLEEVRQYSFMEIATKALGIYQRLI